VTADEHIKAAEELVGQAGECLGAIDLAQVHATLAVAQATIAANRLRPGPTVDRGPR
jgi:hypothetical protein